MTTFPGAPKLTKGALVGIDPLSPLTSVIVFQYNPKTVSRRLEARSAGADGTQSEALRLSGPPVETLELEVEIDATDQLETADAVAATMGIYPQLSALEMLLYPKSTAVIAASALLAAGMIEVVPPSAPFTLFVWGAKRVVPVRLDGFTIEEQEYDPALNPIRASVSLSLRVLSTSDFTLTHPGFAIFLAHQVVKEAMAVVGSVGALADQVAGSVNVRF